MRSRSSDNHSGEVGRDVIHDYIGSLPDDAARVGWGFASSVVVVVSGWKMLRGLQYCCAVSVVGVSGVGVVGD